MPFSPPLFLSLLKINDPFAAPSLFFRCLGRLFSAPCHDRFWEQSSPLLGVGGEANLHGAPPFFLTTVFFFFFRAPWPLAFVRRYCPKHQRDAPHHRPGKRRVMASSDVLRYVPQSVFFFFFFFFFLILRTGSGQSSIFFFFLPFITLMNAPPPSPTTAVASSPSDS